MKCQSKVRAIHFLAWVLAVLAHASSIFAASSGQVIVLDGTAPGKLFEGVGAVSGGGGTSVLLKDYIEPQRSQILDILFKPNFAASMQTLYVEIGGDGNSTQGSEPTHMRTRKDENYSRGYEWWLMSEAKKRNPALTLDACAWSCPGWVGDGDFWSQDMADYYVKWIKGLKTTYGLDLDAIGCRNERGAVMGWVKLFRRTLDDNGLSHVRIHAFDNPGNRHMWDWIPELKTDKDLAAAVNIVGNHTLLLGPFPASVRETIEQVGKPIWNTEEHVYNGEGRFYKDDFTCALGAVHLFNDDFISRGATKIVNWYLAGSIYAIEPYADQPAALIVRSPWSGHYAIKPIIWSYAHYGQFARIGWRYIGSGCVALAGGGTVVTLKSADGDYSVIAETAGAKEPQQVTFKIGGGLSSHALCVWRTTRDSYFERQPDIAPGADGTFIATFDPDAIYSFSTTTGQQKGTFPDVPEDKPFPFPYFENFDHYGAPEGWGFLPHYTADVCGVFELAQRPDDSGVCLRQVVGHKAQSWAPEWMPYTVIGDPRWTDYEVSADIFFDNGGWAGVMGRVGNTGNGWDGNPNGYYARLYADGGCALYVASERYKGSRDRQLAVGEVRRWRSNRWHNLKLRFEKQTITVLVDNVAVIVAQDAAFGHGLAGLVTGGEGNGRDTALFDNLLINRVNGGSVPPTVFIQDRSPIYRP
jgi:galactosylceramidase